MGANLGIVFPSCVHSEGETVIGDLISLRRRIQDMDGKGHHEKTVKAHVRLAEILTYASTLTSLTAGKRNYRMEFYGYEDVPKELVHRVVEEHTKEVASMI